MAKTLRQQYKQARKEARTASTAEARFAAQNRAADTKWKMRANRAAGLRDLPGSAIRTAKFAITGQRDRAARAGGFVRENLRVIRTGSPARSGGRGASDASRV